MQPKEIGFALTDFGIIILQSIVFFVITFGVGIKIIPKLLEHVSKIKMEEALFISSLALAFGLSVLAHFLGLSSAVGAFLMGMIIASTKFSEPIISKVLPLRDFFLIMFFCVHRHACKHCIDTGGNLDYHPNSDCGNNWKIYWKYVCSIICRKYPCECIHNWSGNDTYWRVFIYHSKTWC